MAWTETKRGICTCVVITVFFIGMVYIFHNFNDTWNKNKPMRPKPVKSSWEDLDKRKVPAWYNEAKIGLMVQMNLFAADIYLNEAEDNETLLLRDYNMERNHIPEYRYYNKSTMMTAELFDPNYWADRFEGSGAKYVIFASKRPNGFRLFPSKQSPNWNSVDVGPRRDLVGDLAKAVKAAGLRFGVYYSLAEWFHPLFIKDFNQGTTEYAVKMIIPEIKQIVNDYRPSIFWTDVCEFKENSFWKAKHIVSWLYNESPVKDDVVISDRWGSGLRCDFGSECSIELDTPDRSLMKLAVKKLDGVISLDMESWDYRHNADLGQIYDMKTLLDDITEVISLGGNVLITFGVTKEGSIPPIFEERLQQLGEWLSVNGEAIYGTYRCPENKDYYNLFVTYVCKTQNIVYALFSVWPKDDMLKVGSIAPQVTTQTCITLLGYNGSCLTVYKRDLAMVQVKLPSLSSIDVEYYWVVKFEDILPYNDANILFAVRDGQ